jgi:organic hydroperoxide reductase OsmC/OhrA
LHEETFTADHEETFKQTARGSSRPLTFLEQQEDAMAEIHVNLELTLQSGYAFTVDFGQEGVPDLTVDEPPPLGAGTGPNAARLIAVAIGNCLGASLLFCLRRSRIPVKELRAGVEGRLVRDARGRLRIGEIRVKLAPDVALEDRKRMDRCLALYEDYCLVTESVRHGIPVTVEVEPAPALTAAEDARSAAIGGG